MNRRMLLRSLGALIALPLLPSCSRASDTAAALSGTAVVPLQKPHEEWRSVVSAAAYAVLFEEDTERAFSSPLNNEKRDGTFVCAACQLPLFRSENKFDSGTGWPSFTQPIAGHIDTKRDFKLVWPRTEYHCARCGGHQGHVFNDGPKPRGERWCNNGLALEFVPQGQPLPELRS
jgi:peptide-methionine (R)-S-oxide reductase